MNPTHLLRILGLCAVLASPWTASADGRTDGPEGSEIGQGGYTPAMGGGAFSLQLDWGASVGESTPLGGTDAGAPLFVGATFGFWADDWISLELTGNYVLRDNSLQGLVGPRFRTGFWPISASIALKAGPMYFMDPEDRDRGVRFGISPQVGAEYMASEKLLLGLNYAFDLPFGRDVQGHRIFMNLGYRF